ncbi:SDR family NAD(P)-dependent oxidoreductase [Vibrio proteolyticus]
MSESFDIAIVGMACRFPDANTPQEFWDNLISGKESIKKFSCEELLSNGYSEEDINNPDFVMAKAPLKNYKYFDNHLFGYLKDEVDRMDPQCRLLHECCWHALEDAAYIGRNSDERIGLFAGAASNIPWISALMKRPLSPSETFDVVNWNLPESLITRTGYRLGLDGPVMAIHTACSTSLVAIHTACQSILSGDCELALAGGVSLTLPQEAGYLYQQGMVRSADGHCRPFDINSNGTVGGSGAGILLLKAMDRAIEDNDHIHAVIKGSAINNDGKRKPGFTAPSVRGQSEVITSAQMLAGVEPDQVSYVECHGTATEIGDPIEISALNRVFKNSTNTCMIGSVKSNIGHLDEAAGVASVIKTVMSIKNKQLAPTLHYSQPNEKIGIETTPFKVVEKPMYWNVAENEMRIAGVSSFGIGGTNAHVVVSEVEETVSSQIEDESSPNIYLISGETLLSLNNNQQNIAECLQSCEGIRLSDATYVLQDERIHHQFRKSIVACSREEAINALKRPNERAKAIVRGDQNVCFLFSGQGAQYQDMARTLYETHAQFRSIVDECLSFVSTLMDEPLKEKWFSSSEQNELENTKYTQPVLFIVEYALARCLTAVGIKPSNVIGYSFGELVAATLAGVFKLQDAIELVVTRGQLMQGLTAGAMLSVPLPAETILELCPEGVAIAIDNKDSCVVSGSKLDIDAFALILKKRRIITAPINSNHAAHSPAMKQINDKLKEVLTRFRLSKPSLPIISSVTGEPLTTAQAVSADYWVSQAESTVRFVKGIEYVVEKYQNCLFIEVGPGRDLINLTRRYANEEDLGRFIQVLPEHSRLDSGKYLFWEALGKIWQQGIQVDWKKVRISNDCRRVPLPGYSFDRTLFWPEKANFLDIFTSPDAGVLDTNHIVRKEQKSDWLYQYAWKQKPMCLSSLQPVENTDTALLLHASSNSEHSVCFSNILKSSYKRLLRIRLGQGLAIDLSSESRLQADKKNDFIEYFRLLKQTNVSLGNVVVDCTKTDIEVDLVLSGILNLLKGYRLHQVEVKKLTLLVSHGVVISNESTLNPIASAVISIAKVIGQEFPDVICQAIDVGVPDTDCNLLKLKGDIMSHSREIVTWRGRKRWVKDFVPYIPFVTSRTNPLKHKGTYLLVGGSGFIGKTFSAHLAKVYNANLIITSRSGKPIDDKWCEIERDASSLNFVKADAGNKAEMSSLVSHAYSRYGRIDGIFYLAGITGEASIRSIIETDEDYLNQHLEVKKEGIEVLNHVLSEKDYDFCLIVSSLAPILGGLGFYAYAAASAWLDAYVAMHNLSSDQCWTLVNWDGWEISQNSEVHDNIGSSLAHLLITREEGVQLLEDVLCYADDEALIISTADIQARLEQWSEPFEARDSIDNLPICDYSERPCLDNEFVAPQSEIESKLTEVWETFLGIRPLGVDDDFFDLGGNSLKAITLLSQIHKRCHMDIPLTEFFKKPTIKEVAKYAEVSSTIDEYLEIKPAPNQENWPLSSGQRRIYLQQMFDKESVAYNETAIFRIVGDLDVTKFSDTLNTLMQRHESLRTKITLVNGEPRQLCHPSPAVQLVQLQLDTEVFDEMMINTELKKLIKPFNLHDDELIRLILIKLKNNDYLFFFDIHHIISDGLSQDIFVRDFVKIYQGGELEPLSIQYKDYTVWQHEFSKSCKIQEQKSFWINKLDSIPELKLPIDEQRENLLNDRGTRRTFYVESKVTDLLESTYCGDGTTRFMVFLASYYLLLADWGKQNKFSIGTPILGRPQSELQDVIGMFVNLLPIPCNFQGEVTFRDIVSSVAKTTVSVFENSDIQLEDIVRSLELQPRKNRMPIFDTVFSYMNIGMADLEISGMKFSRYIIQEENSRFDLAFIVKEVEDGFDFGFEYKSGLFKHDTIESLITRYGEILEIMASKPDALLSDYLSFISYENEDCNHEVYMDFKF